MLVLLTLASAGSAVADIAGSPTGPSTPLALAPDGTDPVFSFSFHLGSDIASGTITANAEGNGTFLATSGSLTVSSSSHGGIDIGTYSLLPTTAPGVTPGPPGAYTSPSGAFWFDDLIFPGNTPSVDLYGLVFVNGNTQINIYDNCSTTPTKPCGGSNYNFDSFVSGTGYTVLDEGPGTLSFTPEPSAIVLFTTVLLGIGMIYRRSFRLG